MNEEEAVFKWGKRFSSLRNNGEDLPADRLKVGRSLVSPQELADEYDKHFPPGPPRAKQLTERIFEYNLTQLGEIRMGLEVYGLKIKYGTQEWDVLQNFEVFTSQQTKCLDSCIETTKCNRFDVISGWNFTFVVDKAGEALSVLRARFRLNDVTFSDERPISGTNSESLETRDGLLRICNFPFVPFADFWDHWHSYVDKRRLQVDELR